MIRSEGNKQNQYPLTCSLIYLVRVVFLKLSIETLKKLWKWTTDLWVSFNWSDVDKKITEIHLWPEPSFSLYKFIPLCWCYFHIYLNLLLNIRNCKRSFLVTKADNSSSVRQILWFDGAMHSGRKDWVSHIWIISSNSKFCPRLCYPRHAQDTVLPWNCRWTESTVGSESDGTVNKPVQHSLLDKITWLFSLFMPSHNWYHT